VDLVAGEAVSALTVLRHVDLVVIWLSVGFASALGVRFWNRVPRYVYGLGVSYALFAAGSAVEIELAIADGRPFTWRTVVVTVAALTGLAAGIWAWNGAKRDESAP